MPPFQLETDDRAETPLLTPRNLMPRMRGQPRVIDLAHIGLVLQPLRQRFGIATMVVQPGMQRPEPSQGHETVERCTGYTQTVRPPDQLLMQRLVARDNSTTYD